MRIFSSLVALSALTMSTPTTAKVLSDGPATGGLKIHAHALSPALQDSADQSVGVTGEAPRYFSFSVPASSSQNAQMKTTQLAAATAITAHRLLVVRVNYPNTNPAACDPTFLDKTWFSAPASVAAYFKEMTRGKLDVSGKVHESVVTIDPPQPPSVPPTDPGYCMSYIMSLYSQGDVVRAKLAQAGVNVSQYNTVVSLIPSPGCSFGGLGGGPNIIFNNAICQSPMQFLGTALHEFGHTLGLGHAADATRQDATVNDDFTDIMSDDYYGARGIVGLNAYSKIDLARWGTPVLNPQEIVTPIADGRAYVLSTVSPPLTDVGRPLVLKYQPASGAPLFLSYRQPYGFDGRIHAYYRSTLSVHTISQDPTTSGLSELVRNVEPGKTEVVNGVSIRLECLSQERAIVRLSSSGSFPAATPECDRSLPTLYLPSVVELEPNASVDTTIVIKNDDKAGQPSTSFSLALKQNSSLSASFTPATFTLAPQEAREVTLRLNHLSGGGTLNYTLALSGHAQGSKEMVAAVKVIGTASPGTCVRSLPNFTLPAPFELSNLSSKEVDVTVTNTDSEQCAASSLNLAFSQNPSLTATFTPATLTLAPKASQVVKMRVTHTAGGGSVNYSVSLKGHVLGDNLKSGSVTILAPQNVCVRSAPTLTIPSIPEVSAQGSVDVDLTLRNQDNVYCQPTSFSLSLSASSQLTAEFTPASVSVAPQANHVIKLRLTHKAGTGTLAFQLNLLGHTSGAKALNGSVTVAAPQNVCVRSAPTLTLPSIPELNSQGSVDVDLTLRNQDNVYCQPTSFSLSLSTSSQLSAQFTPASVSVAPQANQVVKLRLSHLTGTGTLPFQLNLLGHASGTKTASGTVTIKSAPVDQCVRNAPSLTIPKGTMLKAGASAEVAVTVANRDSSACAAVAFTVSLSSSSFSGAFTPASFSLQPSESRTLKLQLAHLSGTGVGTYSVALAGHPSGTVEVAGQATVSEEVTLPAPTGLRAVVGLRCPDVTLTWSGAAAGKSFEVFRNGLRIGSSALTKYIDLKVPKGPHRYQVRSLGVGGVLSELSAEASVTVTRGTSLCKPVIMKKKKKSKPLPRRR